MCNFPNIQYVDDFQNLNSLPVLPPSPQGMYSILINQGIVPDNYLARMNVNNMVELENEIFERIDSYQGTDDEMRDIFCLIHIWGGIAGRGIFVKGKGFIWDEIKKPYRALVNECLKAPVPDNNTQPREAAQKCITPIYNAILSFYQDVHIQNISTSFITKHTRFWLRKNNHQNPLPIYDRTFAINLMNYAGVYMRSLPKFWSCMIDKANKENVSLLSLERQLFNHWN